LKEPGRANRFIASITSAVATTPALQTCDPSSILAGGLLGEALNLSPSPQLGQYYLVPFKQKAKYDREGHLLSPECSKAQFVLGYKGYVQLALRSGQYSDLDCMDIRQGEYLGKDPQTGKPQFKFIEDDDLREKLPIVGYMAYFEYLNGFRKVIYWSKDKMLNHANQFSQAFSKDAYDKIQNGQIADKDMWKYSSFWYKDFDSMAKKTLLRQLISKWGIMSTEMQQALTNDSGIPAVDPRTGEIISDQPDELELTTDASQSVVESNAPAQLQENASEPEQIDLNSL
jgi:recombination protein RecT